MNLNRAKVHISTLPLLGVFLCQQVGVTAEERVSQGPAKPAVSAEASDPWRGLRAAPAPILTFAGENYFPVQVTDEKNQRRWEFVRDSEDFAKASRVIVVKIEPWHNLRAYEKAVIAKMGPLSRQIHYRSKQHLTQSWVSLASGNKSVAATPLPLSPPSLPPQSSKAQLSHVDKPVPKMFGLTLKGEDSDCAPASLGASREYRLTDWLIRPDGLQCCEIIVRDGLFPLPGASLQWRRELAAVVQQAPRLLPCRKSP